MQILCYYLKLCQKVSKHGLVLFEYKPAIYFLHKFFIFSKMNAEISSAVDENETRTNLWIDSLMEENENLPDFNSTNNNDFCQKFPYFSPDDTLSALFSNQR